MKKSISLNSREWCDVVFEKKNKLYGAYAMRMESSKRHLAALGITVLFAVALAAIPTILSKAASSDEKKDGIDIDREMSVLVDNQPLEEIVLDIPKPPRQEPIRNTFAYNIPKVGDDNDVDPNNIPPTVDEALADGRTVGYIDVSDGVDNFDAPIAFPDEVIQITEEPQGPVEFAQVMPSFPGGDSEMMRFINANIKYPIIDIENGTHGRVTLKFVVSKSGSIDNIEIVKALSPTTDREAKRVVKNMPKWIPGKQNGNPVAVYFTLPIVFRLK